MYIKRGYQKLKSVLLVHSLYKKCVYFHHVSSSYIIKDAFMFVIKIYAAGAASVAVASPSAAAAGALVGASVSGSGAGASADGGSGGASVTSSGLHS